MQTDEQSGTTGGRRGNRHAAAQARSQQQQNQQVEENQVFGERLHSLIYGYLLRNGFNSAAAALQQDSEHLQNSVTRPDTDRPQQVIVLNDRMHDRNLEEIVQMFNRDGSFGLHDRLMDFGGDLNRLNNRFQTLVNYFGSTNTSRLHQQLYGRQSYSRLQQPQNYSLGPAPQAVSQMRLQQVNQIAEERYRQEQQMRERSVSIASNSQSQLQKMPTPVQEQGQLQDQNMLQGAPEHTEPMEHSQEADGEVHRSRRKLNHPQNYNVRLGNSVNAIADYINDPNYQLDDFVNLNYGFLNAMDYNPPPFALTRMEQDDQQMLEEIFNEELIDNDMFMESGVVREEIVETEEIPIENRAAQYATPPEELLSPVPRASYMVSHQSVSSQPSTSEASVARSSRKDDYYIPSKGVNLSTSKSEVKIHKERDRSQTSDTGSGKKSRRSASPQSQRSHESRRHREREKEKEKDKSRSYEKQERDRHRDERSDLHDRPSSSFSSSHHRDHRSKVQDERESTPGSRTTERDDDKDKKRKERKEREKAEEREKEKQRTKDKKEKEDRDRSKHLGQSSSSYASAEQHPQHVLNTMRTSHAAGVMKQSEHLDSSAAGGGAKRKADQTITSETKPLPFKIPKKNTTSSSSDLRQAGGGSRDSSRTSSPKGDRLKVVTCGIFWTECGKLQKSPPTTNNKISDGGEDRPVATHFIAPIGHLARLSSILINCDRSYHMYQLDHPSKENKVRSTSQSPANSTHSSGPITPSSVTLVPHPKGKMYAPIKGDRTETRKESDKNSTSSSTTVESSDDDTSRASSSSSNNSRQKKPVDGLLAEKLLARVHKQK
ncbi:hypothetical protein L3Y34_008921 [Caenorhabditis briggsae]|uniref:LisH domain-containing protein n=1 Tax=Caenorhabditis briggsae TaxID=6238 RepID=A0AAE9D0W2_CAEBR|nr:hypothetical protein L3Y34_008921 [Caenorhabditis briggsae]